MPQVATESRELPFEVDDAIIFLLGVESRVPSLVGRLEGITRLEKLIFLLQNESQIGDLLDEDPEFDAHHFGPFSSKIYQAVETLELAGLIVDHAKYGGSPEDAWETVNIVGDDAPYTSREFELTERGNRYFQALLKVVPAEAREQVRKIKDRFSSMPLRQLVRYVYERYPAFTVNSKIKDKILG